MSASIEQIWNFLESNLASRPKFVFNLLSYFEAEYFLIIVVYFFVKIYFSFREIYFLFDMTESTELQAFKRQKDGYKVTVKISFCICVVLSWDELKVRKNLLASDYEVYMVCLLVATVYWHESLQFIKKNLT